MHIIKNKNIITVKDLVEFINRNNVNDIFKNIKKLNMEVFLPKNCPIDVNIVYNISPDFLKLNCINCGSKRCVFDLGEYI